MPLEFMTDARIKQLVQQQLGNYTGPKKNAVAVGYTSDGLQVIGKWQLNDAWELQGAITKSASGPFQAGVTGVFHF